MNEIVALASFVTLATFVLVAARLGTISLFVLSATFILLSNITVQLTVRVFGIDISWAIIIYSLVYFITDLVCEFHGKAAGYRLAAMNLSVQVILWVYVWLSMQVTPAHSSYETYTTMEKLFDTTKQVSFAAIVASAGPFLDIYIFSWVRQRWDRFARSYRRSNAALAFVLESRAMALVMRNKLSTFAGQIVNTIIFFTLALFGTGSPFSTTVSIIMSACVVKLAVAIADIPFLIAAQRYILPNRPGSQESSLFSEPSPSG